MSNELLLQIVPANMSQLAFESIRSAIMNRTLAPGSRIVETALADQLNVSKTPVREALIQLREIGLIEPDGRRGDRVVRRSAKTLRDAYDIREGLELFAVRIAAERSSPGQRETIRASAEQSLEGALAGDAMRFHDCDLSFHRAVVEVAGNTRLTTIVENAYLLIATLRERDMVNQGVSVRCGEQHVGISAAIDQQDPRLAEVLLREHIRYVGGRVIAAVESEQSR